MPDNDHVIGGTCSMKGSSETHIKFCSETSREEVLGRYKCRWDDNIKVATEK